MLLTNQLLVEINRVRLEEKNTEENTVKGALNTIKCLLMTRYIAVVDRGMGYLKSKNKKNSEIVVEQSLPSRRVCVSLGAHGSTTEESPKITRRSVGGG